ncbi:MAG: TonB-dependent receptor plug domain-containing protein [Alphaproteobacteria bacterium]|nr:TonB-dependent receptor plug domain-containing protein [Alphaproteobacteria bacterium]
MPALACVVSAVFWAVSAASPAFAQEIVVTAERRAQDASRLATNAASLSGDELAFVAPQTASEALNRLPGVAIHRNNGVENLPAIRSPVLNGGQSAGSFLVLEDGVPIRAPGFANVNQLFETSLDFAARVEVTRGPGSALYGSNAVHGLVNVSTPLACSMRLGGMNGRAAMIAGDGNGSVHTQVMGRTYLSKPPDDEIWLDCWPSPSVLYGVSARRERGWRDQSGLDQQSALFGFDAAMGDWSIQGRIALQNLNQETASFIQGENAYDNAELAQTNPTPGAYRDTQIARARITAERAFGDWKLSLTPYARWIDADLNLSFFPSQAQEISRQKGGGLQAAIYYDPSEALSVIFGADADLTRGSLYEFQSLPNIGTFTQGLHYDYQVDMRVLAAYAQANWAIAENWRVIAGLRGEWVTYDYDNRAPSNDVGRFRRPDDRTDRFDALTPKLGLVWTPHENQTLWLNYARGARPPQITDLYSLQTTQTPGGQGVETIESVELGWRGDLGPARLELAAYAMDKDDTAFRNADGFTVTDGASRHVGVELSGGAPLPAGFDLSGWVTYARHTYRFDNPSTRGGESIRKGDDIDSAPRWIWNARLGWSPHDALRLEAEWAHMGEYFTNAENTRTYTGHDVFNLRGEVEVSSAVTLTAALRNIANTDYAERADFAFGNDRYFPGEGRNLTLGVRGRF